jgi:glutamyl/glutaminyl-tRNA synthetase
MGDLHTGPEVIDDFILLKSGEVNFPTYNFAHIIDDAEMEITHVIRGQEFLASVPNYLNLYEALGLTPPVMATMPHILGPDGKKKLSKRDGAKDVLDYIKKGYLPESLVSFIATLGWNDGTEQEIFTREELIEKFSLSRVQRSGAKFDEQRLTWINGHFIREMPQDELYEKSQDFWPEEAKDASEDYKKAVLKLVSERLKYFAELPELTKFFFTDLPVDPNLIGSNKQLGKFSKDELKQLLETAGVLFSLIRIATTQVPASPGLAETLNVLSKETSLHRIDQQIVALEK